MKKLSFLLSLALIIGIMIPAVHATSDVYRETDIIHTEFGDFEIETVTVIHSLTSRSGSKSADKTQTVKFSGKTIGEVTLSATFGYDGKTAWVSSASGSHTTYDKWSYGSEDITKSGGTAKLTATLSHILHRDVPLTITITCSPTGQVS